MESIINNKRLWSFFFFLILKNLFYLRANVTGNKILITLISLDIWKTLATNIWYSESP